MNTYRAGSTLSPVATGRPVRDSAYYVRELVTKARAMAIVRRSNVALELPRVSAIPGPWLVWRLRLTARWVRANTR